MGASSLWQRACLSRSALTTTQLLRNIDDVSLTVADVDIPAATAHVVHGHSSTIETHPNHVRNSNSDISNTSSPTALQIKRCVDQYRQPVTTLPPHMKSEAAGPYVLARQIQGWRIRDMWSTLYWQVLLSAVWIEYQSDGRLQYAPHCRVGGNSCDFPADLQAHVKC
jgi:hypothetical protein